MRWPWQPKTLNRDYREVWATIAVAANRQGRWEAAGSSTLADETVRKLACISVATGLEPGEEIRVTWVDVRIRVPVDLIVEGRAVTAPPQPPPASQPPSPSGIAQALSGFESSPQERAPTLQSPLSEPPDK